MPSTPHRWQTIATGRPPEFRPFEPRPELGQVVVEVAGCGVCHTDLGFHYGDVPVRHGWPLALGHEVSGRVVATGHGAEAWLGCLVIVPAVIPCGDCPACRNGRPTLCPDQTMPGNDVDGGFATHLVVPAWGLCPVDGDRLAAAGLDLADLAVVADAITTPFHALGEAGVMAGSLVVVVGAGGIGGFAVQIAAAIGAHVVAVDVDSRRIEACRSLGITAVLASEPAPARGLRKILDGLAGDLGLGREGRIVLECSGTRAGQETAFSLLGPGATLGVVGFTPEAVSVRLSNLMAFGARAIGIWGCPPDLYPAALDMVLKKQVLVRPAIERHPLGAIAGVLEAARGHRLDRRAVLIPDA